MDTGLGKMTKLSPEMGERIMKTEVGRAHVFCVGEIVNIKGSRFRIQSIGRKTMKLRIVNHDMPDNFSI